MILGRYDFGDRMLIDSQFSREDQETIFHEFTHQVITNTSLYGGLLILLQYLASRTHPRLEGALRELCAASETTQEMTALYGQCFFRNLNKFGDLDAYLEDLRQTDYYRKYALPGFDALMKNPRLYLDDNLYLYTIARAAMNIDITALRDLNWFDPLQVRARLMQESERCNPDRRYGKLCRAALDLQALNRDVSMEEIAAHAGLVCHVWSREAVSDMIASLAVQMERNGGGDAAVIVQRLEAYIVKDFSGPTEPVSFFQGIQPAVLNPAETVDGATDIQASDFQTTTALLLMHDETMAANGHGTASSPKDFLSLYQAGDGKKFLRLLPRGDVSRFLPRYGGEIVVFLEDYDAFHRAFPTLANRRIFYRFDGKYADFVQQIPVKGETPRIHFHEVSDRVVCLFVLNDRGEAFFTVQFRSILYFALQDIRAGRFIYVDLPPGGVDGCFYLTKTDWNRYEDVILSTVEKSLLDPLKGLPSLGHRINLREKK